MNLVPSGCVYTIITNIFSSTLEQIKFHSNSLFLSSSQHTPAVCTESREGGRRWRLWGLVSVWVHLWLDQVLFRSNRSQSWCSNWFCSPLASAYFGNNEKVFMTSEDFRGSQDVWVFLLLQNDKTGLVGNLTDKLVVGAPKSRFRSYSQKPSMWAVAKTQLYL